MVWVCGILKGVTLIKSQLFVGATKGLVPFHNFTIWLCRLSKGLSHLEDPGSFRQSLRIPCIYNDPQGTSPGPGWAFNPSESHCTFPCGCGHQVPYSQSLILALVQLQHPQLVCPQAGQVLFPSQEHICVKM